MCGASAAHVCTALGTGVAGWEWTAILSHAAWLVLVWVLAVSKSAIACAIALWSLFTSTAYHVCEADSNACLLSYFAHAKADLMNATMVMVALTTVIAPARKVQTQVLLIFGLGTALAWVILSSRTPDVQTVQVVVFGSCFLYILVFYLISTCFRRRLPAVNMARFTIGFAMGLLGIAMYRVQESHMSRYHLVHTMWHVNIIGGAIVMLLSLPPTGLARLPSAAVQAIEWGTRPGRACNALWAYCAAPLYTSFWDRSAHYDL